MGASLTNPVINEKSTPLLVERYLPIPRRDSREFWTESRIQHIRHLASTGKPMMVWDKCKSETSRILDRLFFWKEFEDSGTADGVCEVPDEISVSTSICYGVLELSHPLYLGDMSFGALSGVPNIAIARAADVTETLAGIGEGGLHPEVGKCRRIAVQWASARFGLDLDVLRKGLAVVIKIGQGAKPGIGGHLPGVKVVEIISQTRRIPVGVDAISPAPHHDIYSIEDLEQRILALKEATGRPVLVKVAATNYIPYIATGVARMGADGIIIDGQGAGTGAAPSVVRDNVGIPIELAVATADDMLRREGLRDGFTIIAAGRVSSAEDAAKLMALGADVASIGTAALIAMGCIMIHKCHLGFCPAVITNKITDNPKKVLSLDTATRWVVNLIKGWSAELKLILERLGLRRVEELRGRRDLLVGAGLSDTSLRVLGIRGVSGKS
ncbi:Glutamate synthase [NADPH] large chain [Candidatus Calditenuaceae archaeon HR02]|nr:Glutamate synthase [NADPH] large chain [Candidatus Calditenuaceae archaeon HR02]